MPATGIDDACVPGANADARPVIDRLCDQLTEHPEQRFRFVSAAGAVEVTTFAELHAEVSDLVAQLRRSGVAAGDLVGLVGPNSAAWIVADLALLALGCVSVAFPVEASTEPLDTGALVDRYALSALLVSRAVPVRGGELSPEAAWLEERPVALRRRSPTHRPELPPGVFTVAFSSGTAGTKKGLMLTRAGVERTIQTSARAWGLGPDDDVLVTMPFSSFQQRYLVYAAVGFGAGTIVVPPERLFQKLKTVEPTIILGPPSFFEIVDHRIQAAGLRASLPYRAASVLHALLPRASRSLRARLGRKWTAVYGSRVRLMLTGSAPVPPRLVTVFRRLGAPLHEVYGSTELGWIAFSGVPVDGVGVELGADGSIVVRSPAPQAVGYVFDGVETETAVFLAGGRIATGDLGRIDRAGRLRLTGRKKNVIVTRSGVKISPEELERDVEQECRVDRALVVETARGAGLSCIAWLRADDESGRVEAAVARFNREREPSHRIDRLTFRDAGELTVESGLLTRNLKLDRAAVLRRIQPEGASR